MISPRALHWEICLRETTKEREHESRGGRSAGRISLLTLGLWMVGGTLLAARSYFVEEILFFLSALAVLFALVAGFLLLLILLQEVGRWSVGYFGRRQKPISCQGIKIPICNVVHHQGH